MVQSVVEIRLLGPVEVVRDQRRVDLGGTKERTFLALLAAHLGTPVSIDRCVEALWGDDVRGDVRHSLHTHVSNLRSLLDPSRLGLIEGTGDGYRLNPDLVTVDAADFEEGVQRAGGDDTADGLSEVLDLWRGRPLGDLSDEPWARELVAHWDRLRLEALDRMIVWGLARGEHRELVGELERLVAEHPYREPFWGHLMLALYRGGRQADALQAFQRVRRILGEGLGIEPGPVLQELEERILLQDPTLELEAATPHNLPEDRTRFIGRTAVIDEVVRLFDDSRLLTLTGAAGVGKTRLGIQTARSLLGQFPHGVRFVDLARLVDDDQVMVRIAAVLGIESQTDRSLEQAIPETIGFRRMLVVLDNCEHLIEASAQAAHMLLDASNVKVLATSREPLRVQGETAWRVPSMEVPTPQSSLDLAIEAEAVELFAERARASDPDFELDGSNLEAVISLCGHLDGIPLAIELAAARTPTIAPEHLDAQIDDRFEILTEGARTALPRHRTLKAAIEWSYRLLTEQERQLFNRLGVAVGSFDIDAVVAIGGYDQTTTILLINKLVAKCMVTIEGNAKSRRYRLLESLRHYALDHLNQDQREASTTRGHHAQHYSHQLDEFEDKHHFPTEDLDNLREATRWMISNASTSQLVAHLKNVWPVYRHHTWYAEAISLFEQASNRPDIHPHDEAWLHIRAANALEQRGQHDQAEDQLRTGMRQLGRRVPTGGASWSLRLTRELLKFLVRRPTRAPAGMGSSADNAVARLRTEALIELTRLSYITQRELPASVSPLWSVNEAKVLQDPLLFALAHAGLGLASGIGGLHRFASSFMRRSTELAEDIDPSENPAQLAMVHLAAGTYWLSAGAWSEAMYQTESAISISHSNDALVKDLSAIIHAIAAHWTGDGARAFDEVQEVHKRSRERGSSATELWGLLMMAEISLAHDQAHLVEPWLERAAVVVDRIDQPGDRARIYILQARILLTRDGDERRILDLIREASRLVVDGPPLGPWELETSAGVAEISLDLLESGVQSQAATLELARTGVKTLRSFSRSAPIAKPRLHLVRGRIALYEGRLRTAIALFERSATTAKEMDMPLEEARAHRWLAKSSADTPQHQYHRDRAQSIIGKVVPPTL